MRMNHGLGKFVGRMLTVAVGLAVAIADSAAMATVEIDTAARNVCRGLDSSGTDNNFVGFDGAAAVNRAVAPTDMGCTFPTPYTGTSNRTFTVWVRDMVNFSGLMNCIIKGFGEDNVLLVSSPVASTSAAFTGAMELFTNVGFSFAGVYDVTVTCTVPQKGSGRGLANASGFITLEAATVF